MKSETIRGKGVWNIWLWIWGGTGLALVMQLSGSFFRTPYWYLEFVLYGLLAIGIWLHNHGIRTYIPISRGMAPFLYIVLSWAFGMMYELTLSTDGTGIGGMHQETRASFLLAQGFYIPLMFSAYLLIRRFRLSLYELFFVGGGISLVEALIFRPMLLTVLLSPLFLLSPFVLAYYTLVYGVMIAAPLLFIDSSLLHTPTVSTEPQRTRSMIFLWSVGLGAAFIVALLWGLIIGPITSNIFHLPPGIDG